MEILFIAVAYPFCLLYNPRQKMGVNVKNQQGLRDAHRILFLQLGVAALISLLAYGFCNLTAAYSALMGGLVSVIPNAYFARKLFQCQGARSARQIVNNFYKGEACKIALSILLFALVFAYFKINPVVFFGTYIVTQLVFWFAPVILINKQNRPESD